MATVSVCFSLRARRFLVYACLPMAVAMLPACGGGGATVEDTPSERDADVRDAPERAVEVFEAGAGDATVVFESGLGDDWTPWQQVADEVSAHARVFAHSRPGYGHSETTEDRRDAADIVEELRTLLASHGYAPPYILVGHSFGGAYMELFAKAHPEDVVGLVLVDPRHRDFSAACAQAGLDGCSIPADLLASLPPVQIAEYEAFASTSDEIRAAGAFGTYPVRVLTATSHGFAPPVEALWVSMLGSLADEAADGEQKVFTGAGHYLQVQHPHEVADAIVSLVSSAAAN
jgi:pimeloyl-ACP methyl ester carboxylesterase